MQQLTLSQYLNDRCFNRDGSIGEAPSWAREDRCGNCKHWEILPKEEQPPCGWGVKGICYSRRSKGQTRPSQDSYCMEHEYRS